MKYDSKLSFEVESNAVNWAQLIIAYLIICNYEVNEMFMKAPLSESVFTLAVGWTGCTRQSVRSVTSYGQEARCSNPYFPASIQLVRDGEFQYQVIARCWNY